MEFSQTDTQIVLKYDKAEHVVTGAIIVALGLVSFLLCIFVLNAVPMIFGILSLLFFLAGSWVILTSTKQVSTLQKTGLITVVNTRRFGGGNAMSTYNAKDVDYINYYEWQAQANDRGSNIVLIMRNGTRVKLGSHRKYHIPYVKDPNVPLQDMSTRIAQFMGIRTSEDLGGKINLPELTS